MKETGSKIRVVVITGQGNEGMAAIATKLRTHGYIPNSDLFSPKQAADLLGVTYQTIKNYINEQILSKPGKLTDQEYYLIRQHPEIGERIVGGVEILREIKPLIRHHHERFDGRGYPDGLSGEDIPLGARMIALGETFDCIVADCAFQPKISLKEATDEIKRNAETQFDPEIELARRELKEDKVP